MSDKTCNLCGEYEKDCHCAEGEPPVRVQRSVMTHLEAQILKEANAEYFGAKSESGTKFRITELQARCVIRAWLKHSMPHLADES